MINLVSECSKYRSGSRTFPKLVLHPTISILKQPVFHPPFSCKLIAVGNPESLIASIKAAGMKAGMAIKPKTSVEQVKHLLHLLDYILVMTVEPGFGGQKLIEECVAKVKCLLDHTLVFARLRKSSL